MGEVWRARHKDLKSPVAIKFLHVASAASEETRQRFLTEAQVTASLKSRHAVQVFDFGVTDDGLPYLVMELLDGETLDRRISRAGRLEVVTTVTILRQAARALDRAHGMGIVHRDFKPENVVVLTDEEGNDEAKVLDFGIAKLIGGLEAAYGGEESSINLRNPLTTFTRTGNMVGTPYYMAPEQVEDATQVGPAADLWALGVVAFECLTGKRPFDADTVVKLFARIRECNHPSAAALGLGLPALFDDWFKVICARDPEARFKDAQTAVTALAVALDVPMIPAARPSATSADASGKYAAIDVASSRRATPLAETVDARHGAALDKTLEVEGGEEDRRSATPASGHVPPPAPSTPGAVDAREGRALDAGAATAPARRTGLVAGAVLAALCAVGVIAFLAGASRETPAPAASSPSNPGAPTSAPVGAAPTADALTAPTAATAAPTAAAAAPAVATASATAEPSASAASLPPKPGAAPARTSAPSAKATEGAAPTAAPAPSPTAAPAAPGKPSSSPFQLPPLGI